MCDKINYEQLNDTWGSDHYPIKCKINHSKINHSKVNHSIYRKKTNKLSKKKTSCGVYENIFRNKIKTITKQD